MDHYLPALAWLVGGLGVFTIALLVLDSLLNTGDTVYPSTLQMVVLFLKLFLTPLLKGSSWKRLVRQDKAELQTEQLRRLVRFTPDAKHIQKFISVCRLQEGNDGIPFIYPATVFIFPTVCIMGSAAYPFPAIGSVHVYNTTKLFRKLLRKESFRCAIEPNKAVVHAKKGSEVEFLSTMVDESNHTVWTNSSRFIILHNQRRNSSDDGSSWPEVAETDLELLKEEDWKLSSNASLEYASVSKDFNPIHMSSLAAKLFGFPGVIMHGMYLISRAASGCQRVLESEAGSVSYPIEVSTKFQRPCVLPQTVNFKMYRLRNALPDLYFTVKGKNGKILLDGFLKVVSNDK